MTDGSIHIEIKDSVFIQIKELNAKFISLEKTVKGIETNSKTSFSSIAKSLKNINIVSITQGFQNLAQGFKDLNAPGIAFNSSMADLEVITGLTGKSLDTLGEKARKNALEFGGNAAKSLETYKLLLSQLTPELAKSPVALDAMAKNVSLLSKTMKGDTIGATEVLTTAMNQYGISMKNPIEAQKEMFRMMNIMSAAAKEGSAELPTIKQAVENVGGQAKISGLSFAELNSAIQSLDKAGKKGAEGGTALRSILTSLGKGRFLPPKYVEELEKAGVSASFLADKNISFTEKMKKLQPVLAKDSELINVLFGEYGQAASALIQTADAQQEMTNKIQGTNTTVEQANAVMKTTAEKLARMQARIDDVKLSFFSATGGASAFLEPVSELAVTLSSFGSIFNMLKSGFSSIKGLFTSSAQAADGLIENTQGATSSLTGLKNVLTGIGWTAVATGILMVANHLYDVASGANEARIRLNEFNKGQQKGEKEAQKSVGAIDKTFQGKYQDIQNKLTAREISPKQASDLEKVLIEETKKELSQRIKKRTEYRKDIKKQYDSWNKKHEEFNLQDKISEVYGFKSIMDIAANRRGELARVDALLTAENEKLDELDSQLQSVNAQIKGAKKTPSIIPSLSPTSVSEKEQSKNAQVKRIDVRIENLVKELVIQSTNITESAGSIKRKVTEALTSAVKDFETAI